ncbi:MAG: helix-turn-helix domain-containing protein, partial [Methylohalobius sp.]|nr:helix-turn-helix domain-containing protein [Methylohalobius sp.]
LKVLHKGDFLFLTGRPFQGLIAIKSGMGKLIFQDEHGQEHILAVLLPGELIGFDALSHYTHYCSAVALDTLSYCELPAREMTRICTKIPALFQEMLRHASEAMDCQRQQLLSIKKPASQRLAAFLLDLSKRFEARGFAKYEFSLGLSRQELGNHLDLALATVSGTLKQFEKAGWIELRSKWVRIHDPTALEKLLAEPNA